MNHPRISSQVDADPRHYSFVRDSKIPHGSLDDTRRTLGDVAVAIVIGLAVLALIFGWVQ